MHEVFISYSSKDQLTADTACAVLEQNGIRCWVAPRDVLPGMSWGGSIIDAINSARVMVLVFSDHANKSPQVEREIERAVNRSIPIIPMRIENVLPTKSLEYFISTPHWLDAFTPPLEKHLQRLTEIVRYNLAAQSGVSREPEFGSSAVVEEAQGVRPGNRRLLHHATAPLWRMAHATKPLFSHERRFRRDQRGYRWYRAGRL